MYGERVLEEIPEGWEDWLALFGARLPSPVRRTEEEDGSLTFVAGDPPLVVVRLGRTRLRVAEVRRLSRRPGARVVHFRWVGHVRWRGWPGRLSVKVAEQLIAAAREARVATYGRCFVCNRRVPPEWMADADRCRRCTRNGG